MWAAAAALHLMRVKHPAGDASPQAPAPLHCAACPAPPNTTPPSPWPALRAARHTVVPRRPVILRGPRGPVPVGSVADAHLPALAAWPQWITIGPEAVTLDFGAEIEAINTRWATVNEALRAQGLIVAWRDEPYGVWDEQEVSHATIERAASRFWGTLTLGAHCNGYVADAQGRPTHLWVAQRSLNKPTDPGMLDNLIGGGVPLGQSPWEALQREAFEEAGLAPDEIAQAMPGRIVALHCDILEGLQREHLHVYDLRLPTAAPLRTRTAKWPGTSAGPWPTRWPPRLKAVSPPTRRWRRWTLRCGMAWWRGMIRLPWRSSPW